jgi:NAD+ synthase
VVEKLIPDVARPYKFRLVLPQDLLDRDRLNVYYLEVLPEGGEVIRKRLPIKDYLQIMAANDIKQRVRMTTLYYEAERRHYIVCGTTNKSETVQGFFVKYGDGGVDIEPIAHLYKLQVYQLGRYLGVPGEILSRTPSPDTYSFEVSDEDFYFCLPYHVADTILYAIEKDIPKEEIAASLGLEQDQVERAWADLAHKIELTRHLRIMPPAIE